MTTVMMRCLLIVGGMAMASSASADRLQDVGILDFVPNKDGIRLKLRMENGSPESHFFVEVRKADADSFEKLALVMRKLEKQEKYKLDLDIRSFSASPPGSFYPSERVRFFGVTRHKQ